MAKQKPSFTAFLIPKILPAFARHKKYRHLGLVTSDQIMMSRRFTRECARRDFGINILHRIFTANSARWLVDNMVIKGQPLHFAARKRYIREVLARVAGQVKQVVMVGAGFDTLCLEFHRKYPQVNFFELDQSSTQEVKSSAIAKLPATGPNLHFIPCDLASEKLGDVLKNNQSYDAAAVTLFVVEGVLMYLQEEDVRKLFNEITNTSAPGSYVVFGSIGPASDGSLAGRISEAALKTRKERYHFAAGPEKIGQILAACGFGLLETRLYHELQSDLEKPEKLEAMKHEPGEHYYLAASRA